MVERNTAGKEEIDDIFWNFKHRKLEFYHQSLQKSFLVDITFM